MASLSLQNISKRYSNGFEAVKDFNLEIEDKDFIIFVGPSGCGKSTTLRMIAGLEDISEGTLKIDDNIVNDVEAKDRDIAMVFQSYALYPHLTVYDNMAFGLKLKKVPKEIIDEKVKYAAKILDLEKLLDRKPKALSGGQRQRVAMGRAIVREPKVFLMDEPLSNLDAKLRVQMRSEIIQLHNKLKATTIYVTHDQTEAMTMASRIVVMKKGYIQQIGTPSEIYNHPANIFVATFIGSPAMNLIEGVMKNNELTFKDGTKITLPNNFEVERKKFFKAEKENCIKEREELLVNFYERNKILEAINNLEKESKNEKTDAQIVKLKEDLDIVLKGNKRLVYLDEAINEYNECEKTGEYPLLFGIRPEDIYEVSHIEDSSCLSQVFEQKVVVAELLGHEYFIHTNFCDEKIVAKLSAKHIINVDETVKLVFDLNRAHLFDKVSTKLIK